MTTRYKMVLAYDGTLYSGWQVQPKRRTIQGELERVIRQVSGHKARVHSSGRTDTGVHARAQVAHFDLPEAMEARRLLEGLNGVLDEDIRVASLRRVPATFHARYSAVVKEYRYFIWNGPVVPPPLRLYRAQVRNPLDEKAMVKAARALSGRHDFAAFSANPNREVDGTVRRLDVLSVRRTGSEIALIARGEGFLYKMVRSLAGFLVRVGSGALEPEAAKTILRSAQRTARVPTAEAKGLFLWRVRYPSS
jgi:tRNA pseudouridine38-40 synthase